MLYLLCLRVSQPAVRVASVTSPTSAASLSPWVRKLDSASGRYFFIHPVLRKTQWKEPEEGWWNIRA